jgi:tetratricopeptide (TPR) repeat protein
MTKEQFNTLLLSPSTINLNLVSELEDITQRFPYFQNAHLLLAKQYHGHENIRFENSLRKAAAYASDRSKLYKLIKTASENIIHINEATISEQPNEPEAQKVINELPEASNQNSTVEIQTDVPEIVSNSAIDQIVIVVETEGKPEVTIDVTAPKEINQRDIIEQRLKELQKENKKQALAAESKNDSVIERKKEREKAENEYQKPKPLSPIAEKIPSAKVPVSNEPNASPSLNTDAKHSFTEWLKLKSIVIIPAEVSLTYLDATKELMEGDSIGEKGFKAGDELLENFIKNEPRIVPARSEFYSPGNMARKSAVENEDLISETLARIYAQQGNIRKAIEGYHRLILKNPEKSTYFAALIKELEDKEQP